MKLLIISDMGHYKNADGQYVGWGPTVEEIDYLGSLFSEIRHVAWLYDYPAPISMLPYHSVNVELIPLAPSGGVGLLNKIKILAAWRNYLSVIRNEVRWADAVFLRCPSNIGLLAMLYLAVQHTPPLRWAKYAGNWKPAYRDSLSYAFQRWWLNRGYHCGTVTINGQWLNQPSHVYTFLNPSFKEPDLQLSQANLPVKNLQPPYRLVFAGRVETPKGVGRALQICQLLHTNGILFHFDVLGDGPERKTFESQSEAMGISNMVTFHGWLPKDALQEFFQRAHFMLFPTNASEGWPKVVSEAMACGVVPLVGSVSSIPQILTRAQCGVALSPTDLNAFFQAISHYIDDCARWKVESDAGIQAAKWFTYEGYVASIRNMLWKSWRVDVSSRKS